MDLTMPGRLLNGLDLFSGIGGLQRALSPWVRTVAYCEIDRYCQGVLLSRMQSGDIVRAPIWDDIQTLDLASLVRISSFHTERLDMAGKLKKLTEQDVKDACNSYEEGMSLADLAHIYGISRQALWDLLRRRITLRPNLRFGHENHFYRGGKRADQHAHKLMEEALERGILVNPGKCSVCGSMDKFKDGRTAIQGHHDNYNKPLEVRWLCQKCHHEWHKKYKPIKKREGGAKESLVDIIYGGFP